MLEKIANWYERFSVKFPKSIQICFGLLIICFLAVGLINNNRSKTLNTDSGDTNVYLNEEVCYAGGIYIKVSSLNVSTEESQEKTTDDDGDLLSQYTLNLGLTIEQRGGNFWTNTVKMKSNYFSLKSVNLEAKSKMAVFFECLAKETLTAAIGIAVGGSVNIIEETLNYIGDYTTSSIENAENSKVDFKPIKCPKNQFEPFKPSKIEGSKTVNISFPIKQEYLESKNIIVLAIDQITHFEKRIFLVTRPSNI